MTHPLQSWQLYFPAASLLAVWGLAGWAAQLSGVPLGISPADHGAFMVWGVLGTGMQGFLFTAYAKQNNAPMPSTFHLLAQCATQVISALLLLFRPALPPFVAPVLVLAPWIGLLSWLVPTGIRSLRAKWDDTSAAIPIAVGGGTIGLLLHLSGATQIKGTDVAVYAFAAPIALAVLDRVLPFFSSRVTPNYEGARSPWFLGPLLALSWLGLLLPVLRPVTSALLVALLVRQWAGWRPWPALRTPMIAVLYAGTAWFAVAWTLTAIGAPATVATHAMVVGGLGSLLLGFSMRVVLGHSGHPVQLGRVGGAVFAIAQAAAMIRVLVGQTSWPPHGLIVSAVLLCVAFAGWVVYFVPICFRAWRVTR